MTSIHRRLVYPHRITLINNSVCDVCEEEKGNNFMRVNNNDYIGIQTCDKEECKSLGSRWIEESIISSETLKKEFGDKLYVLRSSGKKESGWEIQGNAYRDGDDSPFWVFVRKEKLRQTKCVSIHSLRSWNM